ncbi:MAG: carboxypeptidase-like regulatory domain-containing protein [Flavobacteriaceae bacterium]
MQIKLLWILLLVTVIPVHSQDDGRQLLRGKVLYRNVNVPNENVINTTTERATITDENGEFSIWAKNGDQLVFTALNYQLEVVRVTDEIIAKNRLVVEVKEKITELEEVVVTPEDQQRFVELKNEELKEYTYETDRSSEVENIALSQSERGLQDGLNLKNIFMSVYRAMKKDKPQDTESIKMSEVMRQVYDDEFFVADLKLPQDKIDAFLQYCDAQNPERTLFKKSNEFQLIDFLVTQSQRFREQLDEEP